MGIIVQDSFLIKIYDTEKFSKNFVQSDKIKLEIDTAFKENRAFPFFPDKEILSAITLNSNISPLQSSFSDFKNSILKSIARDGTENFAELKKDVRLSLRLINAVYFIHLALAEINDENLKRRRFAVIREKRGLPTFYHVTDRVTVISHVGLGPKWEEKPTIYLPLILFDTLFYSTKKKDENLLPVFESLIKIEERAIETGFLHTEQLTGKAVQDLDAFTDEAIRVSSIAQEERIVIPVPKKVPRFTEKHRHRYAVMLNKRYENNPDNFNYNENVKAIRELDKLARRYKKTDDYSSLREVIRLIVSASGHDLHEVRNRANIILERIFSPKEYDAPLASTFTKITAGSEYKFKFDLSPSRLDYFLRIYSGASPKGVLLERDIQYSEIKLKFNRETDDKPAGYTGSYRFKELGQYDYVVYRKGKRSNEWMLCPKCSGRINVIPDVRGRVILEIFPDIHGFSKMYWWTDREHPGLVYNENGEVIRTARFADITAHLSDMKSRYQITDIYILGAQKRGNNREDWAYGATSPSPFSPMSLVEIEDSLGGEHEFKELVKKAHSLDIKIIIDVIPHLNRKSKELSDDCIVNCYDDSGRLVERAATDGRFGSWNDGKLLNYRKFEVWEWLAGSIARMIDLYDIDGIRFDSAHAVPVMMKKNNYPFIYNSERTPEEMLEGTIVVNDRMDEHFITTGFYDSVCRDVIACPIHHYLMNVIERKLRDKKKDFFINLAECYWGREKYLARSGIIPYNSALFKICENITHGKTDVREIYHLYDNYFPQALPEGTDLLGILGNHDEDRPLYAFGQNGLRAATMLTSFMSSIVMDYEGNAEGEAWKVFLDNIYVNWNQFEYVSNRGVSGFYRRLYRFHRENKGKGYLVWTNNNMVAAAVKFTADIVWIGAFSFSGRSEHALIQFDQPRLPIDENSYFRIIDPLYSHITGIYNYITGKELKTSKISITVPYTERFKLLKAERLKEPKKYYEEFLYNSLNRLYEIDNPEYFLSNFSFLETARNIDSFEHFVKFVSDKLAPMFKEGRKETLELGIKRIMFHLFKNGIKTGRELISYIESMKKTSDPDISQLGKKLSEHNRPGPLVFITAEAVPFSKSGGLANVVYELPLELAEMGEEVYVITPLYRNGDLKAMETMRNSIERYNIKYTGINVSFRIGDSYYDAGVHKGDVRGIHYIMLEHHELFDGLYWGYTGEEKLKRRIALSRAAAEVILALNLTPLFTVTNDAYAGIFNGIVRTDPHCFGNENFKRTTFFHIVHNGNWQYFDSYSRYENGKDLFSLFNIAQERYIEFSDPVKSDKINCMATGVRFADCVITVSPSYAKQIKVASDGLERVLTNVVGINNAIGRDFSERMLNKFKESKFADEYYPKLLDYIKKHRLLHEKIEEKYPEILLGADCYKTLKTKIRRDTILRMRNKLMLQLQRGFKVDPDKILFTMIHRVSEQKGFKLLLEASEGIFKNLGFQGIVGGPVAWGDKQGEELAAGLARLPDYYRDKVSVTIGFQDISIPLLASDLFLMPSLYEPGGISQLEALACGCLVTARATGGLRDTVNPVRVKGYIVTGNGFLFADYDAGSFYDAMKRSMDFFKKANERIIHRARINAKKSVYYWDKPARKYLDTMYSHKEIIRVIDN